MKSSSYKKEAIIITIAFIGFLILIHGNDIGDFRNSDKTDVILYPILYLTCVIPILALRRKLLIKLRLKDKVLTIAIFMMIAALPMFLLAGLAKYIDYYATNKQWRLVKGTITHKDSKFGRTTNYLYTVKIEDSTIKLSSTLNVPVEQVLDLKICTTNLGMIIADKYYN